MKILITTPGLKFGGSERVLSVLANQWIDMGHDVSFFITVSKEVPAYDLSKKIKVCYCDREKYGAGIPGILQGMRQYAVEEKPDLAVSFMLDVAALTAVALTGLRIPLVFSERADPYRCNTRTIDRLYHAIVNKAARGFVFQTEGAKNFYSKRVQARSEIILNPLETERFPVHDFTSERDEVVAVGRLVDQKNYPLLIHAFSRIKDEFPTTTVSIYGGGNRREELLTLIDSLGLSERIVLKGEVRNIQTHIKDAKVFAMASDYEGLPNALLEALAMGLPCVSTDCSPGGARMLIEDGTSGCIVPCGDVEALASALERLLSDRTYAQKVGQNALNIRQQVSSARIAGQWLDLFYKLQRGENKWRK